MSTAENTSGKVPLSRVAVVGLMALVASVVLNVILLFVVKAILPLPAEFPPLQPGAIAVVTTMGVVGATIVYAIISLIAKDPNRIYLIVAIVALVVSIIPNIMLMVNPSAAPMPGATSLAAAVLILFHVTTAAICIWLFTSKTKA